MKFQLASLAGLSLAGLATAAPLQIRESQAADIILQIAPKSAQCDAANADCRTNVQLAPLLISAMQQYELCSPGEIAAVLALTAFESVDYQYKHNISPGRPGQGTSNMQMVDYNIKYANSIPALQEQVAALGAIDTDDKRNQLLALVTVDKYNFGSGQWFLTTQCDPSVRAQLAAGTGYDAAFASYMACVGVSVTSDRDAYWQRAKTAFGLSG